MHMCFIKICIIYDNCHNLTWMTKLVHQWNSSQQYRFRNDYKLTLLAVSQSKSKCIGLGYLKQNVSESPTSLHTSFCCKNLLCRFQPYLVSTFARQEICTATTWKKYISLINRKLQIQEAMELVLVPLVYYELGAFIKVQIVPHAFKQESYNNIKA